VAGGVGVIGFVPVDADFEVDVVGAAFVASGEDGVEVDGAVVVGDLDAAKEGELVGGRIDGWRTEAFRRAGVIAGMAGIEAGRRTVVIAGTTWAAESAGTHGVLFREAGVETKGVAVPDVDGGVGKRLAGARVEHSDA
jgi:hypothetical protein